MGTENSILRKQALEVIKGNWTTAIIGFVIYDFLTTIGSGSGIVLIIGGPLTLGMSYFSLAFVRRKKVEYDLLFKGFNNFGNSLLAFLFQSFFIVMWSLLLIIPGIIKSISYSMTFFIMADIPNIKPMDAIDMSMEMMDGYKMKYFLLTLFFSLLIILSGILMFIPLFWIIPYMYITYAEFYEDIKGNTILIRSSEEEYRRKNF
jgi:uncharacterized membrane protein